MPITKAESKAAVTNVINIGRSPGTESLGAREVSYPPDIEGPQAQAFGQASPGEPRGRATSRLACEHAALIYVNRVRRRGEVFSEADIREIIRFLTAADSVQLIVDTQPGCFKSETKIKAAYVDKDGKRTNFIEMIEPYRFFVEELGFSF